MSGSLKEMSLILAQVLKNRDRMLGERRRSSRSEFECLFEVEEWPSKIDNRLGLLYPPPKKKFVTVRYPSLTKLMFLLCQEWDCSLVPTLLQMVTVATVLKAL
jgi:hypothetical protein